MARDLSILLAVLEENGLTTWHRLRPTIASKLNQTWGPVRAIWPVKGLLSSESYPNIFSDPKTNLNLPLSLKRYIKPRIRGKEFDLHISSSDFALSVYGAFQSLLKCHLCEPASLVTKEGDACFRQKELPSV